MKKLFIAALVAASLSFTANAQGSNDLSAVDNFEATFSDASNVKWVSNENFSKAYFIQNEENMQAFYDLNGDLIATTTAIESEELPAWVKKSFQKKYAGYNIAEAFELTAEYETAYFIAAEKGNEKFLLKANEGSLSVYSKL